MVGVPKGLRRPLPVPSGKANMVADALSRRLYLTVNYLLALVDELCEEFWKLELNIITPKVKPMLCALKAQPTLIEEIQVAQAMEPQAERIREEILVVNAPGFVIHEDGTIRFRNKVCIPPVEALKKKILD